MTKPLVSIIICCYNRMDYLRQTMESVLRQSYRPVEIVVVDDGSTDGTPALMAEYGRLIRYYRQDNQGIAAARTAGCRLAEGEYIAFQDDDDLMPPDRITDLFEALQLHPSAVFSVGDWEIIDSEGNFTGTTSSFKVKADTDSPTLIEDAYYAILWPKVSPTPHTTLFRRADGERIGWFDTRFFHACSDTDFYARLGRLGPIVYVPRVVSYFRRGHSSIWSRQMTAACSRFLLLEKHMLNMEQLPLDRQWEALRERLRTRLVSVLKEIALYRSNGIGMPEALPAERLTQRLPDLGFRGRFSYGAYKNIVLPLRRLAKVTAMKGGQL